MSRTVRITLVAVLAVASLGTQHSVARAQEYPCSEEGDYGCDAYGGWKRYVCIGLCAAAGGLCCVAFPEVCPECVEAGGDCVDFCAVIT